MAALLALLGTRAGRRAASRQGQSRGCTWAGRRALHAPAHMAWLHCSRPYAWRQKHTVGQEVGTRGHGVCLQRRHTPALAFDVSFTSWGETGWAGPGHGAAPSCASWRRRRRRRRRAPRPAAPTSPQAACRRRPPCSTGSARSPAPRSQVRTSLSQAPQKAYVVCTLWHRHICIGIQSKVKCPLCGIVPRRSCCAPTQQAAHQLLRPACQRRCPAACLPLWQARSAASPWSSSPRGLRLGLRCPRPQEGPARRHPPSLKGCRLLHVVLLDMCSIK